MTYFGRLSVNTVSAHNSLPLKCDQAGSIDRRAAGDSTTVMKQVHYTLASHGITCI